MNEFAVVGYVVVAWLIGFLHGGFRARWFMAKKYLRDLDEIKTTAGLQ